MKILVIGDYIEDIYHYCIDRDNPEGMFPVITGDAGYMTIRGGAAHVVDCLRVAGATVDCEFGFFGYSRKHRYFTISNTPVFRVDEEKKYATAVGAAGYNYDEYDYIVVSDYNKGSIDEDIVKYLPKEKLIVDTKPEHFDWFKGAYIIKPNKKEFDVIGLTPEEFVKEYDCNLFLTLGSEGAYVLTKDGQQWNMAALNKKPVSVCGAGDAFLAGLVYGLCNGGIYNALLYGSLFSAISCKKSITNCPDLSEINELKGELEL